MSSWNPDLIPDGPDDIDADSPCHAMFCDCIECQAADEEEARWGLADEADVIDLGELWKAAHEEDPLPPAA